VRRDVRGLSRPHARTSMPARRCPGRHALRVGRMRGGRFSLLTRPAAARRPTVVCEPPIAQLLRTPDRQKLDLKSIRSSSGLDSLAR
jgi:hypothetical protein